MPERHATSIGARTVLSTGLLGAVGLAAAGFVLHLTFTWHAEEMFDAVIEDDVIHVATALIPVEDGTFALRTLLETPQYEVPGSGWAWQVEAGERVLLQSGSLAAGERLGAPPGRIGDFETADGIPVRGVAHPVNIGGTAAHVHVAGPRADIAASVGRFAMAEVAILGVLALGLALALVTQLRIGLRPLRDFARHVEAMRLGAPSPASRRWPVELRPAVEELHALEARNRLLVDRNRGEVANLAHALKTPLTVAASLAEDAEPALGRALAVQLDRIDAAIRGHLVRASGGGRLHERASVAPVVDDLAFALSPVLRDRALELVVDVGEAEFLGAAEDLEEILGNLMENAAKWAGSRIRVDARQKPGVLAIVVEDDGPGIAPADRAAVFARGVRLDQRAPGHGLGLSIVRDLVELHGGRVELGTSALGGLAVRLILPGEAHGDRVADRAPAPLDATAS